MQGTGDFTNHITAPQFFLYINPTNVLVIRYKRSHSKIFLTLTMFRWTARGGSSQPVQPVRPVEPDRPVQPSSGSSGSDDTWNGRKLRLVVNDEFNGRLNTGIWEHEVSLWGGGVSAKTVSFIDSKRASSLLKYIYHVD